jgi:FtsP/CotA-like multicopper oxidase with cupredoxin domain
MKKNIYFIILILITVTFSNQIYSQVLPLDPRTLTKYVDALPIPGVMPQVSPNYYEIGAYQIQQQLHSQLPLTTVWGYGTSQTTASYPANTIEALRNVPINIKWTNNLVDQNGNYLQHPLPVDQTLHWADPLNTGHSMQPYTGPVPLTVHVHGAEVEPQSDGHPDSWYTPGFAITGPGWSKQILHYVNSQQPATIWYHDHTLGITRLNVYMGLAGFYIIRDPANEPQGLPSGAYEIPIVIQDRMFNTDGSLSYPNLGVNPMINPFWVPEFFGNAILVNGKVWPYLNVEPRKYRFRVLNGSDARFYNLKLSNGASFIQIGTDGGYLNTPVTLNQLLLAPGERADIIIDFTGLPVGTQLILTNDAKTPYPNGAPADPQTVGQIMQFRVVNLTAPDNSVIPAILNNTVPLTGATVTRTLTLNEVMGMGGPLAMYLDGKMWKDAPTETPQVGTTEIWQIVNLTADAHPIHLHLVQFQLLSRQKFQLNKYLKDYNALNPVIPAMQTVNPPIAAYLQGKPTGPDPNETGWKDTYRMNPGEVTTVIVRFTPQGSPNGTAYPFDATAAPGYVWHCHILEHEDNEMMRPLQLVNPPMNPANITGNSGEVKEYSLSQNYPNPFNPETKINYSIKENGFVSLKVYDMIGREVAVLVNEYKTAGIYNINFSGSKLASGIYIYKLTTGNYEKTMKMMLLK